MKRRRKSHLKAESSFDKDQDDTNFYRCKVCGQVCNKDKVEVYSERKNPSKWVSGTVIETDSDGDVYPDVKKGCPNCGSFYSR